MMATDEQLLVIRLYALLQRKFGKVVVANRGRPNTWRFQLNAQGKSGPVLDERGETYRVNCPFCGDAKQRLWINHQFGEETDDGRRVRGLAHCFNEDCIRKYQNLDKLDRMLFGFLNKAERQALLVRRAVTKETVHLGPAQLPGQVWPLSLLSPNDPAIKYVQGRGFDPAELSALFRVGYCVEADEFNPSCQNRLVCPIYKGDTLIGWQARKITAVSKSSPKYMTMPGFKKSAWLYNHDLAVNYRVVVVVEGVTDVWAVGPAGVALLGKTMSLAQKDLLKSWANKRGLCVLLLDPDAHASSASLLPDLRTLFAGRAVSVTLPDNKDPGDLPRAVIWAEIAAACTAAGICLDDYLGRVDPNSISAN